MITKLVIIVKNGTIPEHRNNSELRNHYEVRNYYKDRNFFYGWRAIEPLTIYNGPEPVNRAYFAKNKLLRFSRIVSLTSFNFCQIKRCNTLKGFPALFLFF